CAAANAGIAAASAPVVELLNDDAEVAAGWADAALRWFADPRVGAVAPLVLQNDPDRLARGLPPLIDSAGDEYDPGGYARKRGHGQVWASGGRQAVNPSPQPPPRSGEGEPDSSSPPRFGEGPGEGLSPTPSLPLGVRQAGPVWGASAAAAFYRRSALLAAGGFPAHFGAYFEDVDLSFRLRRLGYEVWYDPASVVWHRVSASYGKRPARRVLEQQSCNEERVFWRNVRGRDRLRYLPRHAAVLAAKAARRVSEGTIVPWAVGRFRAWCGELGAVVKFGGDLPPRAGSGNPGLDRRAPML
ncbi:MAG TPA: glycosyltransferase family 2 protein, partial [Fimbriiglobus sp.]|nr:glycosyltransferase family 2 protein [Fimbriiglobus sp.]